MANEEPKKRSPRESFQAGTLEEMQAYYDKWADTYDDHLISGDDLHAFTYMTKLVEKYAKPTDLILHVGVGTGLDAVELHKRGFHNQHAHDGSKEMVRKSKEKGIFQECFHELLLEDKQSCFETERYDVMVTVGCFVPMGLNTNHVDDLIRTVKVGGLTVIATREMFMSKNDEPDYVYPYELEKKLQTLVSEGKLEFLERLRHEKFGAGHPGVFLVHRKLK